MKDRLLASRFDATGVTWFETVDDPMDLHVGCELPFWGQKFEFTVRPRNVRDEERRRREPFGHMWLLYDSRGTSIMRGWTQRVRPVAGGLRYTVLTAAGRHADARYTAQPTATDDVPTALATIVSNAVSVVDVNQADNFDSNSLKIGGWRQDQWDEDGNGPADGGIFPADAVEELLEMSDANGNVYDYWLRVADRDFMYPQADEVFYRKRDPTATPKWRIHRNDIARGGIELASDIFDVANTVKVRYGWLTGTHDGSSNEDSLVDSGENFNTEGVQVGDRVFNLTDGSQGTVEAIGESGTTITVTLEGGTDDDWDNGDEYAIRLTGQQEASATEAANYWARTIIEDAPNLTKGQAQHLASQLLDRSNNPFLRQSFTITAPEVERWTGARLPLWYMLIEPATIFVEHLEPTMLSFDTFLDNEKSFFPVRMDYDYRSNRLTVTPNDSANLDTLLRRSGVSPGGMVIMPGGGA